MHILILSIKENYVCFLSASVCPSLFKWKIVKAVLTRRFFSPKIAINCKSNRKSWYLLNILLMRYSKRHVLIVLARHAVVNHSMSFFSESGAASSSSSGARKGSSPLLFVLTWNWLLTTILDLIADYRIRHLQMLFIILALLLQR